MSRVRRGNKRKERRKRILQHAKGFKGKRGTSHRIAKQSVMKAWRNSYIDRRRRKRDFRRLWITRIGAAAKQYGTSYSRFMGGLEKSNVELNRKMLADIAVRDGETFEALAVVSEEDLGSK